MRVVGSTIWMMTISGVVALADAQKSPEHPTTSSNGAPTSAPASQPQTPRTRANPIITLQDFGQPPYQLLRYAPGEGQKQQVALSIRTSEKSVEGLSQLPGQDFPDINLTLNVAVREAKVGGDIRYDLAFADARVNNNPGVPPAVLESFQKSAKAIVGVSATTTVTDRGILKKSELHVGDKPDPMMVTVLQNSDIALQQLWTLLPEEPLGVGGSWRVEYQSDAHPQNLQYSHAVVYKITSIDGSNVQVTATVQDDGGRQPMRRFATTESFKVVSTSLQGKGRGEMTLDLSLLMPKTAQLFVQTKNNMDLESGDDVQHTTAYFAIESRMESKTQ